MKNLSFILILLCAVILLCGSAQAQTERVTKSSKNHSESLDVVGAIKYLYKNLLGVNRNKPIIEPPQPIIRSVNFNKTEITICSDDSLCMTESESVEVTTDAVDFDGDDLLYRYEISGGKIVGEGSKITWDLSGVKAGTYKITVSIDDGCGVCYTPTTKEIKVVECADCKTSSEEPKR